MELACLAVSATYETVNAGTSCWRLERDARAQGADHLFVLTTRTAQWFMERGFRPCPQRRCQANARRCTTSAWLKVLVKTLV